MKDVRIPAENIVGDENQGVLLCDGGLRLSRGIIAAVCCGAANAALEAGIDYIKQRKVFNHPIARYEGIQFKLAEDYTRVDAVRLLAYRGLWLFDRSQAIAR